MRQDIWFVDYSPRNVMLMNFACCARPTSGLTTLVSSEPQVFLAGVPYELGSVPHFISQGGQETSRVAELRSCLHARTHSPAQFFWTAQGALVTFAASEAFLLLRGLMLKR